MGSGESKLEHGMVVPLLLRPLLWRRYQEIKRRTANAGALKYSSIPSKKQLLKDGASEEDASSSFSEPKSLQEHDNKSESESFQEDCPKVAPAPEFNETTIVAKDVKVVVLKNKDSDTTMKPEFKEQCKGVENEENVAKDMEDQREDNIAVERSIPESPTLASGPVSEDSIKETSESDEGKEGVKEVEAMNWDATTEVKVTEIGGNKEETYTEKKEEEDRLDKEVEEARHFCPGSPSFRVYLESSASKKDDDDNEADDENDDKPHRQLPSEESGESVNSNEDSETKTKKKGKRGIRFRNVIRKPRKAACFFSGKINVKILLNVTSCYNPACTGHDKAHLLPQKAAAA